MIVFFCAMAFFFHKSYICGLLILLFITIFYSTQKSVVCNSLEPRSPLIKIGVVCSSVCLITRLESAVQYTTMVCQIMLHCLGNTGFILKKKKKAIRLIMAENSSRSYHADYLKLGLFSKNYHCVLALFIILFSESLALGSAKSSTETLNLAFLLLKWPLFILIMDQPNRLSGRHPTSGV